MEIVYRGRPPEEIPWEGNCIRCGSRIRAREHELDSVETDDRKGDKFGTAECPVCKNLMFFYPQL